MKKTLVLTMITSTIILTGCIGDGISPVKPTPPTPPTPAPVVPSNITPADKIELNSSDLITDYIKNDSHVVNMTPTDAVTTTTYVYELNVYNHVLPMFIVGVECDDSQVDRDNQESSALDYYTNIFHDFADKSVGGNVFKDKNMTLVFSKDVNPVTHNSNWIYLSFRVDANNFCYVSMFTEANNLYVPEQDKIDSNLYNSEFDFLKSNFN